jgi:peroxiredoxin
MTITPSKMLPLGSIAPDFNLPDTLSHEDMTLQQLKGKKGTLIMFLCNHCPFVTHVDKELVQLAHDYKQSGLSIIAISANDVAAYPEDGPEEMEQKALRLGYTFPYLYDKSQATARAYHAVCTPDLFLYDANLHCVYRGQLDDSRPRNDIPVTGQDLRNAIDHVLAGEAISAVQKPSIGCSIKWKKCII